MKIAENINIAEHVKARFYSVRGVQCFQLYGNGKATCIEFDDLKEAGELLKIINKAVNRWIKKKHKEKAENGN